MDNDVEKEALNMDNIILNINNVDYKVNIENNDAVNELLKNIPLTLSMNELNGNEYYSYLDINLKANSESVKKINAGDVMLYGDNCLVIFYKSFNTPYSYTSHYQVKGAKLISNIPYNKKLLDII